MLMNPLYRVKLSLLLVLSMLAVWFGLSGGTGEEDKQSLFVEWPEYARKHLLESLPVEKAFVYPFPPATAGKVYLSKAFGETDSTAEIWRVEPGSGDPGMEIVAMGDGLVLMAEHWGSELKGVVIVLHRTGEDGFPLIEALCGGLDNLAVVAGQRVRKGKRLGRISDARENGLQIEIRRDLGLGLGPGSAEDLNGWIRPGSLLVR
jgi:hypothetical protein